MKIGVHIVRFFVGVLFVFSGLVKANDPMGFGFKLQEYFEAFDMAWLNPSAYFLSIFFCGLEIILGLFLIGGIFRKITLYSLSALIVFFTFLTFYSAKFEVVTSCGCFGDAIPLTPWESFSKDLILCVCILFLFVGQKHITPLSNHKRYVLLLSLFSILFGFGVGIYTYRNFPFIDFLPYKIGNNIPQLMYIPPDAPADEYEVMFELEHVENKSIIRATSEEYVSKKMYQDSLLKIVNRTNKLIKEGFKPKIQDLQVFDASSVDVTDTVLNQQGKVVWVVFHKISETNRGIFEAINDLLATLSARCDVQVYGLTSSSSEEINRLVEEQSIKFPIYVCDAVPLKSMVRSNPGVMLLNKGTVINKWHYNNLPPAKKFIKDYCN